MTVCLSIAAVVPAVSNVPRTKLPRPDHRRSGISLLSGFCFWRNGLDCGFRLANCRMSDHLECIVPRAPIVIDEVELERFFDYDC